MITLTLLHPIQSVPVQSWTFEHEPVIRIGRSTDNHVILYSAVVSRHHVELRQAEAGWEIVNLGANGTYLDGKRITQVPVFDGVIIRLARSGPNIQIHISSTASESEPAEENTISQKLQSKLSAASAVEAGNRPGIQSGNTDISLSAALSESAADSDRKASDEAGSNSAVQPKQIINSEDGASPARTAIDINNCLHPRAAEDTLFCPDCGQPLKVLHTIGDYQIVRLLSQDEIETTYLAWRNGQNLVLKAFNLNQLNQETLALFEQQAEQILQLRHPAMPRFIDFFKVSGQPYLVREQVYGPNLNQQVAMEGPLAAAEAIALILQVCDVLDYLHQQSPPFLHQEIRPSNLIQQSLTSEAGKIAVVGFLSKIFATNSSNSTGYIAPEQQQGHPTSASDLFSLGPTLVYLLTGQEPNSFYAHREQGYRFYPEYVPGLPAELVMIVRRLTSPEPEERYMTAKEVAAALNQVAASAEKL